MITIEVDVRNGIPSTMIVGLVGHAVQEARERVRISLKNSGFVYPDSRVVINLSPASLPKSGTSFDVSIACALLMHTQQIVATDRRIMLLGELHLDGSVGAVTGVISAVHAGLLGGVDTFIVPHANYREACALRKGSVAAIARLSQLSDICRHFAVSPTIDIAHTDATSPLPATPPALSSAGTYSFDHLIGSPRLKRLIEIAIAGHHHCLFVGPPGSGKTFSARAMRELTVSLTVAEAVEVTRLFSIAGLLPACDTLITDPPFRDPHHSISYSGMLGGGDPIKPGEIALAHNGILLLDEALEFRRDVLQGLRQPLEEREIRISRAQRVARFPSDFLLIMTANVCPCGNFGKRNGSCFCKLDDIKKYWRRLGGAFLDRVPLRYLFTGQWPAGDRNDDAAAAPAGDEHSSAAQTTARIANAVAIQRDRYRDTAMRRNGHVRGDVVHTYCALSAHQLCIIRDYARSRLLSYRALHTACTVARTIADVDGAEQIADAHVREAITLRTLDQDAVGDYSTDIVATLLR